jgi:predicted transcriptional regulator
MVAVCSQLRKDPAMPDSYAGKMSEPDRKEYPVVKKFMTRSFIKFYPETDIWEVLNAFIKHKIKGAPVVNRQGALVGMISEKDCLKLVIRSSYENQLEGGSISDFMSTDLVTVGPNDGLNEVAQLFLEHPYKRFPVVHKGKLIGVVMRRDLLVVMQKYYRHQVRHMTGVHRRNSSVVHHP